MPTRAVSFKVTPEPSLGKWLYRHLTRLAANARWPQNTVTPLGRSLWSPETRATTSAYSTARFPIQHNPARAVLAGGGVEGGESPFGDGGDETEEESEEK
jgi:hypothetical protein